jgi:thiosulfate/3-mercaptopyruvate sulfurtransferase
MLHLVALGLALAAAPVPAVVSADWLQAHLNDPQVRIVCVGNQPAYAQAHIPGARLLDQRQTMSMGATHGLPSAETLVQAFTKAGVTDGAHVVLYGDTPMSTGWVYMALMSIGHGEDVSWLDGGIKLWQGESRPVSTRVPSDGVGPLTPRPTPDAIVDATWVRNHLNSPTSKILDVRSNGEWSEGHLPNATLISWEDLYQDVQTQKLKSPDQIRTLFGGAAEAGGGDLLHGRDACEPDVLGGPFGGHPRASLRWLLA